MSYEEIKAFDCEDNIIKIGDVIEGNMSEVLILGIKGEVESITKVQGEPYGEIKGYDGYWHLRQFIVLK